MQDEEVGYSRGTGQLANLNMLSSALRSARQGCEGAQQSACKQISPPDIE